MSSSLAPECNNLKERYDTCFLRWYSEKFIRGASKSNECEPLFKEYNTCLWKALKERGVDTMVNEARQESKETDDEFMRR